MSITSYQSSAGLLAVLLQRDAAMPMATGGKQQQGTFSFSRPPDRTWVMSKGNAMFSISVTASACRVKLSLLDFSLIDQDLKQKQGPVRLGLQLLEPVHTGSTHWLLIISPQVRQTVLTAVHHT